MPSRKEVKHWIFTVINEKNKQWEEIKISSIDAYNLAQAKRIARRVGPILSWLTFYR
jgi:hypothetical protein